MFTDVVDESGPTLLSGSLSGLTAWALSLTRTVAILGQLLSKPTSARLRRLSGQRFCRRAQLRLLVSCLTWPAGPGGGQLLKYNGTATSIEISLISSGVKSLRFPCTKHCVHGPHNHVLRVLGHVCTELVCITRGGCMQAGHVDGNPARSRVSIFAVMSPMCCNLRPVGARWLASSPFPRLRDGIGGGGKKSE